MTKTPRFEETLPASYFDAVYDANADPWQFETSAYEAAKYHATVSALDNRRFRSGFEIGCSIGVLSVLLATHCEHLLSVDVSEAPLVRARARLGEMTTRPSITFERMQVPDEFPPGRFDLVVMSEVGYYWSAMDLERALDRIEESLDPGGVLLLVHWTPPVRDYPLQGDAVHAAALARSRRDGTYLHRLGFKRDTWRLDLFEKR